MKNTTLIKITAILPKFIVLKVYFQLGSVKYHIPSHF